MNKVDLQDLTNLLDGSVEVSDSAAEIKDERQLKATIHRLAEVSAMESGPRQGLARYMTRLIALDHGVYPASINDLYMARGRGEVPNDFTVPAINLRALSFDAARAVFQAAKAIDAGAFIFEIARSEMGYTDQRPAEYVTNVLAAALAEGYKGPVFIQGDHFQVSPSATTATKRRNCKAVRDLIKEAIAAGFYNIDIDTSTLVDLDQARPSAEQQELNTRLSAMFTAYIRSLEPEGITISVGGEIGEVGGRNSTEEELRAYMDGFTCRTWRSLRLKRPASARSASRPALPMAAWCLPDGSIKEVSVDFDTLKHLSRIARKDYGLGGAVQHGASTLPEERLPQVRGSRSGGSPPGN